MFVALAPVIQSHLMDANGKTKIEVKELHIILFLDTGEYKFL